MNSSTSLSQSSHSTKAFGLWSAVFLGIGSMVGAGIFIVIGQAGAIAGNLVIISFIIAALIALLCGYSLSQLAIRYPSRGGIIEYLVQGYGQNFFSGSLGILFYLAQLIALAAVAKSFGTYAATYFPLENTPLMVNLFSLGVITLFTGINLLGAQFVAKSENLIVIIKVSILILFTALALFYIQPSRLSFSHSPGIIELFYALGLTFFAYQGFSVITNSVEEMENPKQTMLKSMFVSIGLVALLYISVSIAVLGNLSLPEIIKSQDFALAQAAQPILGSIGFKIMAATALLATASAINATLYAVTQISYTLAKEGNLPEAYKYNVFHNTEGLIISALLVIPMILFLNLGQIASIAAIAVLLIQGFTHVGHLFKIKETQAKPFWVVLAAMGSFGAAFFAIAYSAKTMPHLIYYIVGAFFIAFMFEVLLRLTTQREISQQITSELKAVEQDIQNLIFNKNLP